MQSSSLEKGEMERGVETREEYLEEGLDVVVHCLVLRLRPICLRGHSNFAAGVESKPNCLIYKSIGWCLKLGSGDRPVWYQPAREPHFFIFLFQLNYGCKLLRPPKINK